jgi:hypothetical protein
MCRAKSRFLDGCSRNWKPAGPTLQDDSPVDVICSARFKADGVVDVAREIATALFARELVSRFRDSLTKSRHLGEDLVGRLRPDKRFRRVVGDRDVLANGGLQGPDASVRTAFDLLLAEEREPAFQQIQP